MPLSSLMRFHVRVYQNARGWLCLPENGLQSLNGADWGVGGCKCLNDAFQHGDFPTGIRSVLAACKLPSMVLSRWGQDIQSREGSRGITGHGAPSGQNAPVRTGGSAGSTSASSALAAVSLQKQCALRQCAGRSPGVPQLEPHQSSVATESRVQLP